MVEIMHTFLFDLARIVWTAVPSFWELGVGTFGVVTMCLITNAFATESPRT